MLFLKGRQFASVCSHDNADKLDINWINRWKSREVACKKLHGEAASVDELSLDNWQKTRLPILLKDFKKEQIVNADETGLFYKCLSDRTHVLKNETCADGKLSREIKCASGGQYVGGEVASACHRQSSKTEMF